MNKVFWIIAAALFSAPFFAFAQLVPEDLSIRISPELPGPEQQVSLAAESFVFSLDRSQVTWTVDGQTILSGVGEKNASFVTGRIGSSHRVTVTAQTPGSGTVSKTVTITPANVDLLWQALDSYTPRFYKGKALNAHDSGVLIQAFPYFLDSTGNQINPDSLIYTWEVNNKVQQSASGFGKSSFVFPGPTLYRDAFVTVEVESPDNLYRARRSLNMQAQPPKLLFYPQSELLGERLAFPLAGNTLSLEQDEVIIRAEPYFFSDINSAADVEYDWRVDGRSIFTGADRNQLTLRRPDSGAPAGRSVISLEIRHVGKLLQFAKESFTTIFDGGVESAEANVGETNFFGF